MEGNTTGTVQEIMRDFARLTGLEPPVTLPHRYLWTDAFAVCNYLELFRRTGNTRYRDCALGLVDQVHRILGRHRDDDRRRGWISGLSEEEGELHPTRGGLRIGKKRNERGMGEESDERQEWDQDGQYYHYLTKWMHALQRVSRVTGDPRYTEWALELARTAHASFTYRTSSGRKGMYWKMSIDLTRPLVLSMGQHDPLDGFITYLELQIAAGRDSLPLPLSAEIAAMADICRGRNWGTDDPLGLGGLLFDAGRVAQLLQLGALEDTALLETILDSALSGLESFLRQGSLRYPAKYRLPFRELGLSIGLQSTGYLMKAFRHHPGGWNSTNSLLRQIEDLSAHAPLGEAIEQFWREENHQKAATWTGHREINMVMLATSLAPEGFLAI